MKIKGQDKDGRLIIDGDGERVVLEKAIPGDNPAILTNFQFYGVGIEEHEKS